MIFDSSFIKSNNLLILSIIIIIVTIYYLKKDQDNLKKLYGSIHNKVDELDGKVKQMGDRFNSNIRKTEETPFMSLTYQSSDLESGSETNYRSSKLSKMDITNTEVEKTKKITKEKDIEELVIPEIPDNIIREQKSILNTLMEEEKNDSIKSSPKKIISNKKSDVLSSSSLSDSDDNSSSEEEESSVVTPPKKPVRRNARKTNNTKKK